MAILDKVMFWKKKKEELGKLEEAPLPGEEAMPKFEEEAPRPEWRPPEELEIKPTAPPLGAQPQVPAYAPSQDIIAKDLEVLSAKLDALRASIESMNQRLANLERIAEESKKRTW